MAWWGKLAGGAFGFMFGGPLGAVAGAAFGHQFDKGLDQTGPVGVPPINERTQAAFFTATFAIMGSVAKVDGRISESEIAQAKRIMGDMRLDADQRHAAMQLFYTGKEDDFDLYGVVDEFRKECHRSTHLIRMFLEIQLMTVLADGVIHAKERQLLYDIGERLGIYRDELEHLLHLAEGFHDAGGPVSKTQQLKDAHEILGVDKSATDAEVKKAYRRLMNQHHPDKLVSKGLPEEMIGVATEKTQQIKKAYDLVKEERKTS
ncbi:MAG: DnaJ like chaperone protein [Parasphingorhabdus sp.]|jgi:DnaJ like chaperone protein